ncbi:MAG: hypothetical protein EBX02_05415 [Betaproteobacteria bacterium]|nr:hypothetical protein [Betaproteobacteria bacterium]NCW50860.1 hypothetical protein [Betaproteobacteria bacterium]NCX88535.1 hypothetical protein [Betaproteobacteria bacterium]
MSSIAFIARDLAPVSLFRADPAVMQTFAVNHRQIAAQSELLSPRLIKVQPAVVLSISPESLEIARMPQVLKGM